MVSYQRLDIGEAEDIAVGIKLAREKLNISLRELARRAGVSQPMAFGVAKGRIQMRTPNLRKLELYVQITLGGPGDAIRSLDNDVLAFMAAGGNIEELRSIIMACTSAKRDWTTHAG